MGARTAIDWNKLSARNFASQMEVRANIVRSRLESGGPLRATEIQDGVRLTHDEFLRLFELAKPALWRDA